MQLRIEHVRADDAPAIEALRTLLRAYAENLVSVIGPEHICLTAYEAELKNLPGSYCVSLIGKIAGQAAGCVLLKPITASSGERACEMKRLWVEPRYRSTGLGRALALKLLDQAKDLGFTAMYLDTVPASMQSAFRLYRELGFEPVPRYNDNRAAGVEFFRRRL